MSGIFDNLKLPLNIDVQTKCKYDDWHDMTAPVYVEQLTFPLSWYKMITMTVTNDQITCVVVTCVRNIKQLFINVYKTK